MKSVSEAVEAGLLKKSVGDLDLRRNSGLFMKVAVVSETKSFFICRNNEPTETTSEMFFGYDRVVVPGPKWRGRGAWHSPHTVQVGWRSAGELPQECGERKIAAQER
ncbi:hypothetical protein [Thermogymnomonas acidicola]|uniref:hypothetical protein n=1 Tax=Thermogymnomonas acidicola TaxID=399579 RepID=UPI0009467A4E|nr:hypothetical protein [Thermogymnomonas acidicola]